MSGFEYRKGERTLQKLLLDKDAGAIVPGDALTESGATGGFVKKVDAASEAVIAIAFTKVTADATGADGDSFVMGDTSKHSVYEVGAGGGTITQAMSSNTVDVGADGQSIDITASATDDLEILEVDVTNNKAQVRLLRTSIGGVV